jgi:histidine triad (HIT) family protein
MSEERCIFCRIARGEVPATLVHEDDEIVAFRDVDPKAPTHILIIPRRHVVSVAAMDDADRDLAGQLLLAARDIAQSEGLTASGFRVVTNTGPDAGQSVDHLHIHVLGGRAMRWPPG